MNLILRVAAGGSAASEASKADSRRKESDKLFESMKGLKNKVDDGSDVAKKKFNSAYDKLFANGEAAAKAATKLIKQYEKDVEEDSETESALTMLEQQVRWWEGNKSDHHRNAGEYAHDKLQQAEQTWAYGTKVDDWIIDLNKALKGEFD